MAVNQLIFAAEGDRRRKYTLISKYPIGDPGSYFSTDDIEGQLQELGIAAFTPGGSKVAVDVAATPDYIGAASNDGVLRTGSSISYTDGGNFVTLNTIQGIRTTDSPEFAGLTLTGFSGVLQSIAGVLSASAALADGTTATTQAASDNSTKVATTAYVDTAVGLENLWDRNAGTATLSPHNANDNLDLGSGNFDTTGDITGGNVTSGADPGHTHTAYEAAGAVGTHESTYDHTLLHSPITLDANADTLLSLSTQELGLDTQVKNIVLAGPATGVDAVPTFRALVADDIPDLSATYLPLEGGTMTGALYMGENGVYFDRGSVGVDFEGGSGGVYFDHGELKFYDTLLSLTLSEMGLPKLITLVATSQAEGDKHLTDANWAVSKAKIETIRIDTASTNWDAYLLQNDNGYATDDARIKKLQIMKAGNGNAVIQLGIPYEDEDGTNEVHLYLNDVSGSNTFNVTIQGYQLR